MPLPEHLRQRAGEVIGAPLEGGGPLSGGCVGEVYGVEAGGLEYVVKVESPATELLVTEGRMLRHLAEQSPLPAP
ncbi:MAG TPA: fructosamine kinase, partial [Gammaproteobacteria bacterium]|nr:fructosamine kinase [Gammaproteobacteria bacterium]